MHFLKLFFCVFFVLFATTSAASSSAAAAAALSPASTNNNNRAKDIAVDMSQDEARAVAAQLSRDFIDVLYEIRNYKNSNREQLQRVAKKDDDDFGGDDDDSTTKLISKAANALRPVIKEMASLVNTIIPPGPQRKLIKVTADAIDSMLPLILKYALGI